jgi:hypothetical protein
VHEIEILVTLQVDSDGKLSLPESEEAAKEAVENALRLVEGSGFSHSHADVASVGISSVDIT